MEFFQTYRSHIIYFLIVVASVVVLRVITNFFFKRLAEKSAEKFPTEDGKPLMLVKYILNILWFALGGIALAFIWVEKDKYTLLVDNFKLVSYLGIVAATTIVIASTVNRWFLYLVHRKQAQQSDPTNLKFLRYIAVASIYFVGFLLCILAFPSFQGVAKTALGGAGVIAIIAGIVSQEALANIVSGVFIISFKPFKVGDIIKLSDILEGEVVDITRVYNKML